jgi:putative transcriptional regulator
MTQYATLRDLSAVSALRGEIQLSGTVYHVPPETDVRALRETLGLSQSDFAALFGFNVRSLQDWELGRRRRRSPSVPTRQ